MTYEQVIKTLVNISGHHSREVQEAIGYAVPAVEKQIPYGERITISKAKLRRCKCGMCYSQESIKFCTDCGQAIDWSEE